MNLVDSSNPLKYLLLLQIATVGMPAYSQSTGCLTRTTVITVIGRRGKDLASPIGTLSPEDLRVKVGGKTVAIESMVHSPRSPRVTVVLDVGSRQSDAMWKATRWIAHDFPSHFLAGSEFSLVAFDDKVEQTAPVQKWSRVMDEFVDGLARTIKERLIRCLGGRSRCTRQATGGRCTLHRCIVGGQWERRCTNLRRGTFALRFWRAAVWNFV